MTIDVGYVAPILGTSIVILIVTVAVLIRRRRDRVAEWSAQLAAAQRQVRNKTHLWHMAEERLDRERKRRYDAERALAVANAITERRTP